MDTLGHINKQPSMNKLNKWNYLDLSYESQDDFNEATSKIMNILYKENSDGKCQVIDNKGNKYNLDIIHANFDSINYGIRILPIDCKFINHEIKPDKNDRKQNTKRNTK